MKSCLALVALAVPAHAQSIDLLPLYDSPAAVAVHHVSAPKAKKRPRKSHSFRPAPAETAPKLTTEAITRCLAPVRVVGSQDVRPDAAEESAKKAWAEQVRWNFGEAFMNIENATDYRRMCSRSSIGEAMGAVLNRCEITASPCRPGMTEAQK